VLTVAFTAVSAASTLEDEFDMELELVLIAVRAVSTLVDEVTRLLLDV
jgi:hypothetical protein